MVTDKAKNLKAWWRIPLLEAASLWLLRSVRIRPNSPDNRRFRFQRNPSASTISYKTDTSDKSQYAPFGCRVLQKKTDDFLMSQLGLALTDCKFKKKA